MSALGFRPFTMAGPCVEVGCAVCVAQIAVLCVWHEPVFVVAEELLEGCRTHGAFALLLKHEVHVLLLGAYHALVVYGRECVELLAQRFKLCLLLGICQRRQLAQVDVYRIERKDADARIWIGVGPSARRGSIVDGQQLQHSLTSVCHEVGHCGKVTEVAYAEAAFGAQ